MIRRPTRSTRTDTRLPDTTLFRSVELGPQPAGRVGFAWDGLASDGSALAPGSYVMSAQVVSGTDVRAAETFAQATVLGVSLAAGSGHTMLRVEGAGEMALSPIRAIFSAQGVANRALHLPLTCPYERKSAAKIKNGSL